MRVPNTKVQRAGLICLAPTPQQHAVRSAGMAPPSLPNPNISTSCCIPRRAARNALNSAPQSSGSSCASRGRHLCRCTPNDNAAAPAERCLIIECDGILLDVQQDGHREAFNRAFHELGYSCAQWSPPVYEDLLRFGDGTGPGLIRAYYKMVGWPIMLPTKERPAFVDKLYASKQRIFKQMIASGDVPLRPGARELIDDAIADGVTPVVLAGTVSAPEDSVISCAMLNLGPSRAPYIQILHVNGRPDIDPQEEEDGRESSTDNASMSFEQQVKAARLRAKTTAAASFARAMNLQQRGVGMVVDPALLAAKERSGMANPAYFAAIVAAMGCQASRSALVAASHSLSEGAKGAGLLVAGVPPSLAARGGYSAVDVKFDDPTFDRGMSSHPYGVQPEHVADLLGDTNEVRTRGLGRLSKLSDEALLNILGFLPAPSLALAAAASRALYVFANHEELWKAHVLEELCQWEFKGSWQDTYVSTVAPSAWRPGVRCPRPINRFYSDLLHRTWLCATLDVDPAWLEVENIDRRTGLRVEEFREQYERVNRPVILTDVVSSWPAATKWNREYLRRALGSHPVQVGDAPMPFDSYCRYADAQRDELPLYLFDKHFARSSPQLEEDFTVPPHFSEDLFALLGEEQRPDYRWLIAGPYKSGSTFHQDPNATSAWNAVIAGSKKWVMYPPHVTPPGVRASPDGADVASPVSIMEWFLSFYSLRDAGGVVPMECTLKRGEILFVPRGWWHTALNLEETLAVTQNYVSPVNLRHVLAFLKSPHADVLVSGVRSAEERATLHDRFLEKLQAKRPDLLERLQAENAERRKRAEVSFTLLSFRLKRCRMKRLRWCKLGLCQRYVAFYTRYSKEI